jgi:hypothetical protein
MMRRPIKALFLITAAALLLTFAACSTLDVVQKDSVRAFGEVLNTLPATEYEPHRWKLTAPDGDAWLLFDNASMDMILDAAPFIAAGLDTSKLENAGEHAINPGKDSIYFSSPGFDMLNQNVKDTALEQFKTDVKALSNYIGYHTALGHYNIALSGGNMFEWAKDMDTNDKDIVFVLDPEPLIAAGVDPNNIEGWVFAKVTVDIDGKPAEVDKLLKPFNLK